MALLDFGYSVLYVFLFPYTEMLGRMKETWISVPFLKLPRSEKLHDIWFNYQAHSMIASASKIASATLFAKKKPNNNYFQ